MNRRYRYHQMLKTAALLCLCFALRFDYSPLFGIHCCPLVVGFGVFDWLNIGSGARVVKSAVVHTWLVSVWFRFFWGLTRP